MKNFGFTLLEIMVVIAIFGLVSLGGIQWLRGIRKAELHKRVRLVERLFDFYTIMALAEGKEGAVEVSPNCKSFKFYTGSREKRVTMPQGIVCWIETPEGKKRVEKGLIIPLGGDKSWKLIVNWKGINARLRLLSKVFPVFENSTVLR